MSTSIKPPVWFWVVSVIALLWNLMGVGAFIFDATRTAADLAGMEEGIRSLYENKIWWSTAAYAVAVFGGALACIALLLRKKWAVPLFIASFIGVIVQNIDALFVSNHLDVFGPGGMVMPILVVAGAIALIWFSRKSRDRGWIS